MVKSAYPRGKDRKSSKGEGSNKYAYEGINGRHLPKEDRAKFEIYKLQLKDGPREERLKDLAKKQK